MWLQEPSCSSPGPCPPSKPPSPACRAASPQVRKSKPDFAGTLAGGPRQPGGETHENCPRHALRATRRNARVAVSVVGHEEWVVDDVSCRGHHEVRPVVPGRGQADEG